MKVTEWTWDNGTHESNIISDFAILNTSGINYEEARATVIDEIRKNNYHFTGSYHQEGEFGCPVIDDKYYFQVTQREWGSIMADAYPNECYYGLKENDRYLKWSWITEERSIVPQGKN